MTNLAHWQDDIDEALGGDFDGSLSGLCIMSLSFDFTRNGSGPHQQNCSSREMQTTAAAAAAAAAAANNSNHQNISTNGILGSAVHHSATTHTTSTASCCCKSTSYSTININHDDNSNHFSKRFKLQHNSTTNSESNNFNNEQDNQNSTSNNNQNKIFRQLQQLKSCLNTTALNTSNTLTAHYSNVNLSAQNHTEIGANDTADANNRLSPNSSETSCNQAEVLSTVDDDSSRSSTVCAGSASPSQSCSSITTDSRASSRSQSPSYVTLHSSGNNNNNNNNINPTAAHTNQNSAKNTISNERIQQQQHNDVLSHNSAHPNKDNLLLGGGTVKESSYTTSVVTTTAPIHFKSIHHPFPMRQIPLSPYHQFSNSSFNHDLYLSHDQPLQTPLIGIDRTQDLLALKLPPHGPDHDADSQRYAKDWPFEETKHDNEFSRSNKTSLSDGAKSRNDQGSTHNVNNGENLKRQQHQSASANDVVGLNGLQKSISGFQFNYKSNSNVKSNEQSRSQHEPIDLNVVSYDHENNNFCNNRTKNNIFDESMKHFNPDRVQQNASTCYENQHQSKNSNINNNSSSNHNSQNDVIENENEQANSLSHQYHAQESMFGIDPSKQKFHYMLAAPTSVATKLNEDTMTYLNQGQAYEIKLENMTDVSEAKKGFMCSIINIGFQERHMQQAENELWQQWSHQQPNEKIFSVDMKLSYNVFGVESDGLNKYEFLWDSSKVAGVFIRINSISTEFTPKKHGGEKGVPFKLSIETFSYNSKTHDSFFISAACCQIKVFKPKGAERKIRSDKDKVSKRPLSEQEKYHRSCDHTVFKECSLTSLHPSADGSLCYYRHSHGHFASKQVVSTTSTGGVGTPSVQTHVHATAHQSDEEIDQANNNNNNSNNNSSQHNQTSPKSHHSSESDRQTSKTSSEHENNLELDHQREFHNNTTNSRNLTMSSKNSLTDYSTNRLMQQNQYGRNSNMDNSSQHGQNYAPQHSNQQQQQQQQQQSSPENNSNNSNNAASASRMGSSGQSLSNEYEGNVNPYTSSHNDTIYSNNPSNISEQYVNETNYYQTNETSNNHDISITTAAGLHAAHLNDQQLTPNSMLAKQPPQRSANIHLQQATRCLSSVGSVTTLNHYHHQTTGGWSNNPTSISNNNNNLLPKGGKSRNGNILSAVLCLVKELDYVGCEVVETALHCRMEETSQ